MIRAIRYHATQRTLARLIARHSGGARSFTVPYEANENPFPAPLSSPARGSAGTDRLDCRSVPAADLSPFHATLISNEGQHDHV
jgi:hypothetical protein